MFIDIPRLVDFVEDVLDDLGLQRGAGAPEVVERDVEPLVDVAVDGVVAVAELARAHPLLQRPRLGGRAVFVGAADVEGLIPLGAAESGKYIGREHLGKVAEVGDVVHIGERAGDQSLFHTAHDSSPSPLFQCHPLLDDALTSRYIESVRPARKEKPWIPCSKTQDLHDGR